MCQGGGKSGSPVAMFNDGIEELLFSFLKLFSGLIIADSVGDFIKLVESDASFEKGLRLR